MSRPGCMCCRRDLPGAKDDTTAAAIDPGSRGGFTALTPAFWTRITGRKNGSTGGAAAGRTDAGSASPLATMPRGKAARARAFQDLRSVRRARLEQATSGGAGGAKRIPPEVLQKVQRLEIQMKHLVNDVFSGEYHSVFKGRGMEFAEVREYMPGDDIRTIDWNVTARLNLPFVKKYVEERELTVVLAVDLSASGVFGSGSQLKRDLAVEVCSILAFAAIKNNDKVGCALFTDDVELFIPPRKGRQHVLRVIRELLYFKPVGSGTNMTAALQMLGRVLKRKSVLFVVSDFLDANFEAPLSVLARRHDVIPIVVTDAREEDIRNVGLVDLVDAETGEAVTIDTSSPAAIERFARRARRVKAWRERIFKKQALDSIEIRTDTPYVVPLMQFFRRRARRH
jgi:uncharacterized protein (DUF58 family)